MIHKDGLISYYLSYVINRTTILTILSFHASSSVVFIRYLTRFTHQLSRRSDNNNDCTHITFCHKKTFAL